jgi:hypothetical protein
MPRIRPPLAEAPPLVTNKADINAHLYKLFSPEFVAPHPDAWIEVAYGDPAAGRGVNLAAMFSPFRLNEAVSFAKARNKAGCNVYIGPALRQGERPSGGRANDELALTSAYAWIDYDGDGDDDRIKDILKQHDLKPALVVTTGTIPHPRRHLYFKLAGTVTPEQLKDVNVALQRLFGSDAVHNASRIMRLAGTINYPPEKKRDRGYIPEVVTFHTNPGAPAYQADDLVARGGSHKSKGNGFDSNQDGPRTDDELVVLLEASRVEGRWHNSIRDAIAVMIGRGWSNLQIKLACAPYCIGKYNDADLVPLIESARTKWDKPDTEEPITAGAIPEAPRLLTRELPPADPFPDHVLGDVLGPAARAICDKTRAPMAICGQSVLAAATLAVQGYADIELLSREVRPVSDFFLSIAVTGERKSTIDGEALRPFRARENTLKEEYDVRLPQYKNAKLAWEKARDAAVKAANGDQPAIYAALNSLGPEPVAPLLPKLTCSEPTFEGLCKLAAIGQPSLGIFSPEGAMFIGGHGMNDEAKMRTAGGLSCFWGGETVDRVRGGDGASSLPGRRLSMHLMCQPDVAAELLADPFFLNQGLLSRFLVSAPTSNVGTRFWREPNPQSDLIIKQYGGAILRILQRPLPLVAGRANELSPPVMKLSEEAREICKEFSDDIEDQLKPDGELSSIAGLGSKLAEHATRLAAVLQLLDDIESREVSAEKMSAGIVLAQHYATEALRLFASSKITADLLLAEKLLHWLTCIWGEELVSLPDIYQRGLNAIGDKATAAKLVAILVDHGWLLPIEGGARVAGQYRKIVLRIVKG